LRAAREGLRLEAPELLDWVDEFGDGIGQHILAVFPNFMLHQFRNLLMTRHVIPRGIDRTELVYTAFGFEDDDAVMTERRLRLANLVGPAGFVSMEDGAAPGFVQRGAANADNAVSIIEMGGSGFASGESRLSEAAVRGMWASYRQLMSL
jgi:anthranilate 1,2-dioxygenase large subunit